MAWNSYQYCNSKIYVVTDQLECARFTKVWIQKILWEYIFITCTIVVKKVCTKSTECVLSTNENFCDYPPFKLKNHPISKMMPNLKVTVCIKMRIYFDLTDICFSIDCRLAPKLLCVDNLYNHIQYFCCPKKAHNLMSSTFKCCKISQETHQKGDQIEEGEWRTDWRKIRRRSRQPESSLVPFVIFNCWTAESPFLLNTNGPVSRPSDPEVATSQ